MVSLVCGTVMTLFIEMPFTKVQKKLMNWTKDKMKNEVEAKEKEKITRKVLISDMGTK